jgi:hypothetical protein
MGLIKDLIDSSPRVIKSHCQWCGGEIHYDEKLHSLWGNCCRDCNIDFARLVRERITRDELNHRIKLRSNPHENEIWRIQDDFYKVNILFQTYERIGPLIPLALTHERV